MAIAVRRLHRRTLLAVAIALGLLAAAGGWFFDLRARLFDRAPPQFIIVAPTASEIV
jgi:hypothetical protein